MIWVTVLHLHVVDNDVKVTLAAGSGILQTAWHDKDL